jgi:L-threonylcarbamoyladenylate synthase
MAQVSQAELITAALAGKVVSFPTDTVPALAVLPQQSALIFAVKKRPQDKPLIMMGASATDLWHYVTGSAEELAIWQAIAEQYWPGQLTLVLPASSLVSPTMNPTNPKSIGLRVPNFKIAQEILAKTGPLATTSANLSGEPPLETMREIAEAFPDVFTLNYWLQNEKQQTSAFPSTVAKWTGKDWHILRQGKVKLVISH